MQKKVCGKCKEQNNDLYTICVNYIDSSTTERTEYSKNGLDCQYNKINKTCKSRNDCPIWKNAPEIIDGNGIPLQH